MRFLLFLAVSILAASTTAAQVVTVPNCCDGQMRHLGTSILCDKTSTVLTVRPMTILAGRAFAAFAAASLPNEFDSASLEFDLAVVARGTFEIAFYGCDATTFEWDFDLQKPLAYGGAVELEGTPPDGPVSLDVTEALRTVMAAGPSYVIAKFFIRTGHPGPNIAIHAHEAKDHTGPRLILDGSVPVSSGSLGDLKSLFR